MQFWHRFIREDGQISVARAFVRADWENLLQQAGITTEQADDPLVFPVPAMRREPLIIGGGPAGMRRRDHAGPRRATSRT